MIKPIFAELAADRPKRHFTVGIYDDVTHLSLPIDASFRSARPAGEVQAVFLGLGSDGTVGANKASVKIIGESTGLYAQGYFVYDSKKSGSITVSHLRFGPEPIRSTYLIDGADFVACHQFGLLGKTKVLDYARRGATFLLNAPYPADEIWDHLPVGVQAPAPRQGDRPVGDRRPGRRRRGRHGRPDQHRHAALLLPAGGDPASRTRRSGRSRRFVEKTYAKRGDAIVQRNFAAIDRSLAALVHVSLAGRSVAEASRRRRRSTPTRLRDPLHPPAAVGRRRPPAGQRPAGRRDLPERHRPLRKARDRPDAPDLGSRRSASTAASAPWSARTRRSG